MSPGHPSPNDAKRLPKSFASPRANWTRWDEPGCLNTRIRFATFPIMTASNREASLPSGAGSAKRSCSVYVGEWYR